uniref:DNA/RNA non-specific endonuclease domain-containing protein n=1 Tax=Glossina brevipalpis TaxID=37001 RepID=A0A1A9WA99_9MUSC
MHVKLACLVYAVLTGFFFLHTNARKVCTKVGSLEDVDSLMAIPSIIEENGSDVKASNKLYSSKGCHVTLRGDFPDPQPVLLNEDATDFLHVSDNGVMHIMAGGTVHMWCPKQFKLVASELINITCIRDSTFMVDSKLYNFSDFTCNSWPSFTAQKTAETCNGGILIRVGFEISPKHFIQQMKVCFDEKQEVTRYVYHTLGPASNYFQTGIDRISFQTGEFFNNKDVDHLYTQVKQQETITNALGGDFGSKFFNTSKNIYLARGHMAAKADFVFGTQQRATFLFVNAAPQWQVFNAGNWARIEDGLRIWVSKHKINVSCYTGVYGVTSLPNSDGSETSLYLAYDSNNNGLIPVPKIYFRIVTEPSTKRGIVFVGVNNPHLTIEQITQDYIFCNDVSDKVTYINWKKHDITLGYSYACTVSEFLKNVPVLPSLDASGGLLI